MCTAKPMKQDRKSTDRRISRISMEKFVFNDEVERQMGRRTGKYIAKKQGKDHFDGFGRLSDLLNVSSTIHASEVTSELSEHLDDPIINAFNKQQDSFILDGAVIRKHGSFAVKGLSSIKKRYSNSPPRISATSLLLMLQADNKSNGDLHRQHCQEDSKTEGFAYIDRSIPEEERVPWDRMGTNMDAETNKERADNKYDAQAVKAKIQSNQLNHLKKKSDPTAHIQQSKDAEKLILKPRRIEPQFIRKSNGIVMPNITEREEVNSQSSKMSHKPNQDQASLIKSKPASNSQINRPTLGYSGPISAPPPTSTSTSTVSRPAAVVAHISFDQPEVFELADEVDDRQHNKKRSRQYRKSASGSEKSVNLKQPRKQRRVDTVKLEQRKESHEKQKKETSRPSIRSSNSCIATRRQKLGEGVLPEELKQQAEQYHSLARQNVKTQSQSQQPSRKENVNHNISIIQQESSYGTNLKQNNSRKVKLGRDRNRSKKSKNECQSVRIPSIDFKSSRIMVTLEDIVVNEPGNSKRTRLRPLKFWQGEKVEQKKGLIVGISTTHPELSTIFSRFLSKDKETNVQTKQEKSEEQQKLSKRHPDRLSIETTFGVRSNHRLIEQMAPNTYRLELAPYDNFQVEKGFFKTLDIQLVSAKLGKLTISFNTTSHKLIKYLFVSAYEDFKITNNSATKAAIIEFIITQ